MKRDKLSNPGIQKIMHGPLYLLFLFSNDSQLICYLGFNIMELSTLKQYAKLVSSTR